MFVTVSWQAKKSVKAAKEKVKEVGAKKIKRQGAEDGAKVTSMTDHLAYCVTDCFTDCVA